MRHKRLLDLSFVIHKKRYDHIRKKIKHYTAKIALERQHFTEDGLMFDLCYANLTGVFWGNYILFSTAAIIYFWQKLLLQHNFDFL